MLEAIVSAVLLFNLVYEKELLNLSMQFLERDPRDRIGSDGDAKEIKQHPFFREIDWVHEIVSCSRYE